MVAMFSMAYSANAQYNVDGHKFWDNWSIGVEGGITTNSALLLALTTTTTG